MSRLRGPRANSPSSPTLVLRIVAALFPRVPDELALPTKLQAGAIVPAVTLEELRSKHAEGTKDHTAPGPDEVLKTLLSRSPLPRTLTSTCRCTRRACGPVSFQRVGKGKGLPCCQSQASPPRNHRRTGRSVCWTQRVKFSKESYVTILKPLLRALGASQIISTAYGRDDRRSTPSRTSSPPPVRPSWARDGTAAPRSSKSGWSPREDHAQHRWAQKQPTRALCSRHRFDPPVWSAYLEMRDGDAGLHPSSRGCTSTSLPARDQWSTTRFIRCDVRDSRRTSAGPTGG
ncbi:unnamed protein product [Trichogramma brassicae]|uniref:Uncharacterized protein n=1 Tax=Trichogramma brassicae TaxID=86971 RepID=A0A6H5ITB4_9HYME|nr:unnamed protein product [Trichogramma brassicae]